MNKRIVGHLPGERQSASSLNTYAPQDVVAFLIAASEGQLDTVELLLDRGVPTESLWPPDSPAATVDAASLEQVCSQTLKAILPSCFRTDLQPEVSLKNLSANYM